MDSFDGDRCLRVHLHYLLGTAVAGAMGAAVLCFGIARAQDVPPDSALLEKLGIMTTQTGLDTANNPLDAIVASLAAACSTEPPLDTRPCPGEKRLLSFLRRLSPDQDELARILEALETTCHKEGPRLDCFYERHVFTTPAGPGATTIRWPL